MKTITTAQKLTTLAEVLKFCLAFFGALILIATIASWYLDRTAISLLFIAQMLGYIGYMALGIIVCFTDILFEKTSAVLRIVVFTSILYLFSLLYFSGTSLNPLGNGLMLFAYTTTFAGATFIASVTWASYQTGITKRYAVTLKRYQDSL